MTKSRTLSLALITLIAVAGVSRAQATTADVSSPDPTQPVVVLPGGGTSGADDSMDGVSGSSNDLGEHDGTGSSGGNHDAGENGGGGSGGGTGSDD